MKIEDLAGKKIKIGQRSITCIGDNGKTCGVVTGITKYKDLRPNIQMGFAKQMRDVGIWGGYVEEAVNNTIYLDGDIYYLDNKKPQEFYESVLAGRDGFESDKKHYNERIAIAQKAREHFIVIPCYVLY